ncbi:low molecular weight protein-tyrosine-phosphatase [Microbulbifer sp. S227A]|uniref:low molecular weight protein-tyrosine-phosphatase n=1 Tax=Microbulbifer sp. S227A TaxID=3415131 RepID=UPI003C7B271F
MTTRVLFVCLGNICRSPTAEAVFRGLRPDLVTDSAGTAGYHVGEPPYGPMQDAARKRGIGMSDLRARQFGAADFSRFDLILGMDAENLRNIEALRPKGAETLVRLLTDYGSGADVVPDPYYTRDFEGALDIIEAAAQGLARALD